MKRPSQCRCSCGGPANFPVYRYMRLVGPLPPEIGTENREWIENPRSNYGSAVSHELLWNWDDTPESINISGHRSWRYRAYPVRFELHNHAEVYQLQIEQPFLSPNFAITGLSSVLPPASSHLDLTITSARLGNGGFETVNNFSGSGDGDVTVSTTHYRLWLDGVDVTGIVALPTPFTHSDRISGNIRRTGGAMPTSAAMLLTDVAGKTVWIDLWVDVLVYRYPPMFNPTFDGPGAVWHAAYLSPHCNYRRSEFDAGNVNSKRSSADRYRYTFSDNGPGGLSSVTPTTPGWTLTADPAQQSLINNSVGAIWFDWRPESPVLTLQINALNNVPFAPAGPIMRYMPVDRADYSLRLINGNTMQTGVWNPNAATVFQQVARQYDSALRIKGSGIITDEYFDNFPATITVEKV